MYRQSITGNKKQHYENESMWVWFLSHLQQALCYMAMSWQKVNASFFPGECHNNKSSGTTDS